MLRGGCIALALLLAACGAGDEEAGEPTDAASARDKVAAARERAAIDVIEGSAIPATQNPFSSRYTALDLANCDVTERAPEGESATWRCDGYTGIDLIVQDGDGRFDIDAGDRNGDFDTLNAFNSPGATIEWRLYEELPFAIIYRLEDATSEGRGRSVLFVETIARNGKPGCVIGRIAADTPNANAEARKVADRYGRDYACGRDAPRLIGETA